MPKFADPGHRLRVLTAERDKVAKEVRRLKSELFRLLPKLFEGDVTARKQSIEAHLKELAKLERRLGRSTRTEKVDRQIVMFK